MRTLEVIAAVIAAQLARMIRDLRLDERAERLREAEGLREDWAEFDAAPHSLKHGQRINVNIPKNTALGGLHDDEGISRRKVATVLDPMDGQGIKGSHPLVDLGVVGITKFRASRSPIGTLGRIALCAARRRAAVPAARQLTAERKRARREQALPGASEYMEPVPGEEMPERRRSGANTE